MKSHAPGSYGTLKQKIRWVYLRFLLVSVLCIVGCTLLHWLIFERFALFRVDEIIVLLVLPVILASAAMYILLLPRLAALQFGRWYYGSLFYCVMAFMVILAPLVIAQYWLSDAAGGMTHLASPAAVATAPQTKYYTFASAPVDKVHTSQFVNWSYQGRHHDTIVIDCYFACPFTASSDGEPVWLGTDYERLISSGVKGKELLTTIKAFLDDSVRDYRAADLTRATYFSRPPQNKDLRGLIFAIAKNNRHQAGAPTTVLLRHTGDFDSRTGSEVEWFFGTFGAGALFWFVLLLFVRIDAQAGAGRKDQDIARTVAGVAL